MSTLHPNIAAMHAAGQYEADLLAGLLPALNTDGVEFRYVPPSASRPGRVEAYLRKTGALFAVVYELSVVDIYATREAFPAYNLRDLRKEVARTIARAAHGGRAFDVELILSDLGAVHRKLEELAGRAPGVEDLVGGDLAGAIFAAAEAAAAAAWTLPPAFSFARDTFDEKSSGVSS